MTARPQHGGRRGVFITAAATGLLTALGVALLVLGLNPSDTPGAATASSPSTAPLPSAARPPAGSGSPPSSTPGRAKTTDFGALLPGSPPVGLDIPAIGVRSSHVVELGLQDDGTIEVPRDASAPGWFTPGPSPGQLGPAVVAGHVDSTTGPGVFYRLGQLRPADRVDITRADGTVATFVIDRVRTYEKDDFPTRAVYGATDRAELRLITCSGNFDDDTGYDSNTVAFAHLV